MDMDAITNLDILGLGQVVGVASGLGLEGMKAAAVLVDMRVMACGRAMDTGVIGGSISAVLVRIWNIGNWGGDERNLECQQFVTESKYLLVVG